jgi:glycosyltransferase involved in cell wall biosynthesis
MRTLPIKIVHVIDSLRIGGAETLLVNTINDLAEFDHVIIALNEPEDLKDKLPATVKYYRLKFAFRKANFIPTIWKLRKIFSIEKPAIIHAHLYWSIIMSRIARWKPAKFIFTLHGMMGLRMFTKKISYHRILERVTLSPSQHLVAVSKTVYDDYNKYIPFKGVSHIIYNYVPDEYFQNGKEDFSIGDRFRLVTVGSLRAIKNHEIIVKAIGILGSAYSLDIYGYGDTEERLKKLAQETKANVSFKGGQKNINTLLPAYDLFVMSSFSEGHSIALLEAMALNMPMLLSNIPSFRETTQDKALFFEVNDAEQLAGLIRKMKEDESLRKKIAQDCHEVVCRDATRQQYLSSLRKLYKV